MAPQQIGIGEELAPTPVQRVAKAGHQKGECMVCKACGNQMVFDYQVEERKVLFKLWHCGCGHKTLERKSLRRLRPVEMLL